MTWPMPINPHTSGPRFLAIAHALIEDVQRGRLRSGQRLPGSRVLAQQLGVHRNTVLAALAEVEAQGWIETVKTRGTFVSRQLPDLGPTPPRHGIAPLGIQLRSLHLAEREDSPTPRGVFALSAGAPDPRLVPVDALARAWRRLMKRRGHRLLEYGPATGEPSLRRALADMVSSVRAVPATDANVLVTHGSQMALDLCARALVRPGDVVAVERLGYRPAWEALRLAGARLVPLDVDAEGLKVAQLERLARQHRLRAVYTTPHHQYPTTVTLSAARRLELLALARRHRFAILEDDYDHEFHYSGRPVLPLASADDAGVVLYLGTLSKVLAPGLRLGFIVAPVEFIERAAQIRGVSDRQGDHSLEAAVAELLEEGELQRHIRKMRTEYLARREVLVKGLTDQLGDELVFEVPAGGISVWVRPRTPGPRFERWRLRCLERGVRLAPGSRYAFDGQSVDATRVVFSRYNAVELKRAIEAMVCFKG